MNIQVCISLIGPPVYIRPIKCVAGFSTRQLNATCCRNNNISREELTFEVRAISFLNCIRSSAAVDIFIRSFGRV